MTAIISAQILFILYMCIGKLSFSSRVSYIKLDTVKHLIRRIMHLAEMIEPYAVRS